MQSYLIYKASAGHVTRADVRERCGVLLSQCKPSLCSRHCAVILRWWPFELGGPLAPSQNPGILIGPFLSKSEDGATPYPRPPPPSPPPSSSSHPGRQSSHRRSAQPQCTHERSFNFLSSKTKENVGTQSAIFFSNTHPAVFVTHHTTSHSPTRPHRPLRRSPAAAARPCCPAWPPWRWAAGNGKWTIHLHFNAP